MLQRLVIPLLLSAGFVITYGTNYAVVNGQLIDDGGGVWSGRYCFLPAGPCLVGNDAGGFWITDGGAAIVDGGPAVGCYLVDAGLIYCPEPVAINGSLVAQGITTIGLDAGLCVAQTFNGGSETLTGNLSAAALLSPFAEAPGYSSITVGTAYQSDNLLVTGGAAGLTVQLSNSGVAADGVEITGGPLIVDHESLVGSLDAGPGPVYAGQFCTPSGCVSSLGGTQQWIQDSALDYTPVDAGIGITVAAVDAGAMTICGANGYPYCLYSTANVTALPPSSVDYVVTDYAGDFAYNAPAGAGYTMAVGGSIYLGLNSGGSGVMTSFYPLLVDGQATAAALDAGEVYSGRDSIANLDFKVTQNNEGLTAASAGITVTVEGTVASGTAVKVGPVNAIASGEMLQIENGPEVASFGPNGSLYLDAGAQLTCGGVDAGNVVYAKQGDFTLGVNVYNGTEDTLLSTGLTMQTTDAGQTIIGNCQPTAPNCTDNEFISQQTRTAGTLLGVQNGSNQQLTVDSAGDLFADGGIVAGRGLNTLDGGIFVASPCTNIGGCAGLSINAQNQTAGSAITYTLGGVNKYGVDYIGDISTVGSMQNGTDGGGIYYSVVESGLDGGQISAPVVTEDGSITFVAVGSVSTNFRRSFSVVPYCTCSFAHGTPVLLTCAPIISAINVTFVSSASGTVTYHCAGY